MQQQNDSFQQLTSQIQQQNWSLLATTAHKLKGICANLSLPSLTQAFNDLETYLKSTLEKTENALDHSALKQTIIKIHTLFDNLTNEIQQHTNNALEDSQSTAFDTSRESLQQDELIKLLQALSEAAKQNEINEDLLTQLLQFSQPLIKGETSEIYQALNDFEFTRAQQLINELFTKIA